MKKLIAIILVICACVGMFGCGKSREPEVDPNAIARVVLGDTSTYAYTVEEMLAAVSETGNSTVTLLKDLDVQKALNWPYSLTLDMNGHTITTNPNQGIGMSVEVAGSECAVTTVKNGKIYSCGDGIRAKAGALVVSGMQIVVEYGNCVAIYDNNEAYKDVNRIENSTLLSKGLGCFAFGGMEVDFTNTGITIESTQLIACSEEGEAVFRISGGCTTGLVELGEGISVYSYADSQLGKNLLFNGSGMAKTVNTEVTVDGTTYTGINKWCKDTENQVIDVLMIGNSFCWYFTEELHGVANAGGVQLNINNIYDAGCYVNEHWQWLQEDSAKYQQYWITNDFGRVNHPGNLKLSTALAYEDWDVITLQQHFGSGVKSVDAALAKCTPYADDLFTYLKNDQPGAKLYWHTTWAYQVGHESMPSTADQKLRQNNIIKVSQTIIERNGVLEIPGGQAWANARANPLVGDKLCRTDLYHDGDVGGGQYLNACVWYEVITGKSCIGNTWRPTTYHLSEEKIEQLQIAAHQAVAQIYGPDYAK